MVQSAFLSLQNMQECKRNLCCLALSCIFAAVAGATFAHRADQFLIPLMRTAVSCRMSIVGSAVVLLPFLISCFLLIHSRPWLVCFICAAFSFLLTSAFWSSAAAFGSAGWLIGLMLHFQLILRHPALLYFSVQKLLGRYSRFQMVLVQTAAVLVGMIDYIMISPFLAGLFNP